MDLIAWGGGLCRPYIIYVKVKRAFVDWRNEGDYGKTDTILP